MPYVPCEALALFRRLGVNVWVRGTSASAISLRAKRYHLDCNSRSAESMANMNAARAAILNSYRNSAYWRVERWGGRSAISATWDRCSKVWPGRQRQRRLLHPSPCPATGVSTTSRLS